MLPKPKLALTLVTTLVMSCMPFPDQDPKIAETGVNTKEAEKEIISDESLVELAQKMPKEDILRSGGLLRKLARTRIYISLTTSPERIKNLGMVFRTLDLSFVEAILLILPEKFSRNQELYVIPDDVRDFPRVKIIRTKVDRGPISKLLGVFELDNISEGREIAERVIENPDNLVITVDDDTTYPFGTITQLIKAGLTMKGVFAASGNDLKFWTMDPEKGWPTDANLKIECHQPGLSSCHVVEGFGGVIYRVSDVQKAMADMLALGAADRNCFSSDDFVINYALARNGIERFMIKNEFITIPPQMSFGFDKDALHKGAGMDEADRLFYTNQIRYQKCFQIAAKLETLGQMPK